MDARERRKHDLEKLIESQGGLHKLKELYREAIGNPPGHPPSVANLSVQDMIPKILKKEFPEE